MRPYSLQLMAYSPTKAWKSLGHTLLERAVRTALLVTIFSMPFGAVLLLSEHRATIAGSYNTFAVPKLYLLEILIVATALGWAKLRPTVDRSLAVFRWPLVVIGLAGLSVLWAPYRFLAGMDFVHLFVAFLLLYMLAHEFRNPRFVTAAVWAFTASAALQATWAITQFGLQHDLGLQRFGESSLSVDRTGVAKVLAGGQSHIRAYGSLPHPNILAAYLTPAIFWVGTVIWWPFKKVPRSFWKQTTYTALLILLGTGLLMTFSRTAILIIVINGLLVAAFSWRAWRRLPAGVSVATVGVLLAATLLLPALASRTQVEGPKETGVTNRVVGYELTGEMILNRPLGVGAGNFVTAIDGLHTGLPDYQHQPVHNALALIAAELGVAAAVLIAAFIIRLAWLFHRLRPRDRQTNTLNFSLFCLAGAFIVMGSVDHFFWSQPQGLWLVAAVTALVASRIPEAKLAGKPSWSRTAR